MNYHISRLSQLSWMLHLFLSNIILAHAYPMTGQLTDDMEQELKLSSILIDESNMNNFLDLDNAYESPASIKYEVAVSYLGNSKDLVNVGSQSSLTKDTECSSAQLKELVVRPSSKISI